MSSRPSPFSFHWRIAVFFTAASAMLAQPAWAVVGEDTTRQVAQGLALLDPWVPALLLAWLALGAWSWWRITKPQRAKRQLRAQLGADAPMDLPQPNGLLWLAGACVLLLALLGWAVADPSHAGHGQLVAWDLAAQAWAQQHISLPMRAALQQVTDTGDVLWLGLLACGVAVVLALRRRWLVLQVWLFAVVLNGLVTRVLKNAFARERPDASVALVTSGASFPSGHTAGAIIVYGLLWLLLRRHVPAPWRLPVAVLMAVWVALISVSRVLLEAHFASDVLAGALLGVAILSLVAWALARGQSLN